ncbi:MAG: GNAT family N-acetyltransferase [Lachnospiraceae bacterium]|nr:GNAT family N-acetyltransferase [Lachnospiraceae bacterium]
MEVRKLAGEERYAAYLTAVYCFHMRVDDVEARRERQLNATIEDWGAFDDNNTLMARIINNHFDFYMDGTTVKAGGIGAVATLPEYRNSGAIRAIFKDLLPEAYANGEVISALYPFKHEFYRKFGYETVIGWSQYSLTPELLCRYRFDGEAVKWKQGSPVDDFLAVYNDFAPQYNLAHKRTEEQMLEHMKVEKEYIDRRFSYVLKEDGEPIAYVIFTDIKNDPAAILQVEECTWTGREGFRAVLGFLARFEADYGTIELRLPAGIDLLRVIVTPNAYAIKETVFPNFMVRVINAKKLLETIKKPSDCNFTIRISDEMIEENNRTYRVLPDRVELVGERFVADDKSAAGVSPKADLEINVRALGQLAIGALNVDEAMLRTDVTVNANEEMLRRVFIPKKIYVGEHF